MSRPIIALLAAALFLPACPAQVQGAASPVVTAPARSGQARALSPQQLWAKPEKLRPGSYLWQPERAPQGDVVMVVSLPDQRLHVYRGGTRIAISTISSGKRGKETPTGAYEILQKKRMHRSNLYNNAPMPFMQRMSWDGIALHAGALPGYPASHGCVRLPRAFAELLYGVTRTGAQVVVVDESSPEAASLLRPGDQAPMDAIALQLPYGLPAEPAAPVNDYISPNATADLPLTPTIPAVTPAPPPTSGAAAFLQAVDPAKRVPPTVQTPVKTD